MSGLSDYTAKNTLAYLTGQTPFPSLPLVYLALFNGPPTNDAVGGGSEVTGNSYARVQVAGTVGANGSWSASTPNITMFTNPGWVVPGMNVYDTTNSQQIGTVLTYVGTALVLTGNAAHASSGTTDTLTFSAFAPPSASSGNEPVTTPAASVNTGAVITFAQASGTGWGTVNSWALYDSLAGGNPLWWDYLGNFKWIPFTGTLASPSVITAPGHGYSNNDPVVVTQKYGGTLPQAGSFSGVLTVAGVSGDTFNVGVNAASASGEGQIRKIVQQPIPGNVTASFATSSFTLSLA